MPGSGGPKTQPDPPHLGQSLSTCPLPPHLGQVAVVVPVPPQEGHVTSFSPEPSQTKHGMVPFPPQGPVQGSPKTTPEPLHIGQGSSPLPLHLVQVFLTWPVPPHFEQVVIGYSLSSQARA